MLLLNLSCDFQFNGFYGPILRGWFLDNWVIFWLGALVNAQPGGTELSAPTAPPRRQPPPTPRENPAPQSPAGVQQMCVPRKDSKIKRCFIKWFKFMNIFLKFLLIQSPPRKVIARTVSGAKNLVVENLWPDLKTATVSSLNSNNYAYALYLIF